MNAIFFVNCRWYTTPCKTVLNAETFVVEFVTGKHSIVAKVSDKCYFLSIDDTTLSNIKCDFYFGRNYNKPKEFLSNLYETFQNFLNTSIPFAERHFPHSTDDVIRRILELQEMKKEQLENVNENDYAKLEKDSERETKGGFPLYTPVPKEPKTDHIYEIKVFRDGGFSFSNEFSLESSAYNAFKKIEICAIECPNPCFKEILLFKDGKVVKRSIIHFGEKLV